MMTSLIMSIFFFSKINLAAARKKIFKIFLKLLKVKIVRKHRYLFFSKFGRNNLNPYNLKTHVIRKNFEYSWRLELHEFNCIFLNAVSLELITLQNCINNLIIYSSLVNFSLFLKIKSKRSFLKSKYLKFMLIQERTSN